MEQKYEIVNRNGLVMEITSHIVGNPKGTAIIHHGYVGNMSSPTVQLMRTTFNELGFNTVTPNTTHNYNRKSGGDYREMTLRGHCEDLMDCVVHTVNANAYTGTLVIAGHSAGGYSALVASSELEEKYRPSLTVASAPLISGQRYMEGWKNVIREGGASPEPFMKHWKNKGFILCESDSGPDQLELHWSVLQDWCLHDLIQDKVKPNNPTYLIGGETDPFITQSDIIDYFQFARVEEASFIKGGDHCYHKQEKDFAQRLREIITSRFPQP